MPFNVGMQSLSEELAATLPLVHITDLHSIFIAFIS